MDYSSGLDGGVVSETHDSQEPITPARRRSRHSGIDSFLEFLLHEEEKNEFNRTMAKADIAAMCS